MKKELIMENVNANVSEEGIRAHKYMRELEGWITYQREEYLTWGGYLTAIEYYVKKLRSNNERCDNNEVLLRCMKYYIEQLEMYNNKLKEFESEGVVDIMGKWKSENITRCSYCKAEKSDNYIIKKVNEQKMTICCSSCLTRFKIRKQVNFVDTNDMY